MAVKRDRIEDRTDYIPLTDDLTLKVNHVKLQVFTYDIPGAGSVKWNITLAQQLVKAGHVQATSVIAPEVMQGIAERYQWEEAAVREADPSEPGIAAPLIFPETGEAMWVLIDGTHRNVKALREGLPFSVVHLTLEANRLCILSGPPELIP